MELGIEGVQIRQFGTDDVDRWARTDLERRYLAEAVRNSGDYLAAVLPDGRIAGKVGIRYDERPGAGNLFQFDVAKVYAAKESERNSFAVLSNGSVSTDAIWRLLQLKSPMMVRSGYTAVWATR